MIKNYLKMALRNLLKSKMYSFINIVGLASGMAVALMIGLWVWDELSFDKYHQNYDHIAQVIQSQTFNGEIKTENGIPIPLANELRKTYGSEFKHTALSTYPISHILSYKDKQLTRSGNFMEPEAPEMFTLKMIKGSREGISEPGTILLSETAARALFDDADPMNKLIRIDDSLNVKVTGVYENLPENSTLKDVSFMASWASYVSITNNAKLSLTNWGNNGWQLYAQIADHADMQKVSDKIKNAKLVKTDREDATFKPVILLQPMSKWHLYAEYKNGINTGGRIQYLWMFGIIGAFVLLLACINFMNLSTARSEKRAREVGVRKAVGSLRLQLITQFLSESTTVAILSLIVALVLVLITLPLFNILSDKQMSIPYGNVFFWIWLVGFTLFTGVIAGSYPAFYLSGFSVVKVLKGTFRAGPLASVPRKVLVVAQFSVSVILIIGTIIVFRQIQFTKNRPVGYSREGLLSVEMLTPNIHNHFTALRNDLLNSGVVVETAESSSPATEIRNEQSNFQWKGKDLNSTHVFATVGISMEFGKTVGWQFADGRDFSKSIGSDAMGFVINESAQKYMGLQKAVGETVNWMGYKFNIVGVIKDMVMQSPYKPVSPTIFYVAPWWINVVNIKIKPGVGLQDALGKIESVFKRYSPGEPFNYKFADEEYAHKFSNEERVGKLATVFAFLAIFISCLGLFGLASFVAEQRIKEIGVRKVLGASVFNLWRMLSKDFLRLVLISLLIASPIAYYVMHRWLEDYQYRSEISWWIFASAGIGAVFITLLTVSYQSIKAALMNPVKSLRSE